jgi:hypothetical protein
MIEEEEIEKFDLHERRRIRSEILQWLQSGHSLRFLILSPWGDVYLDRDAIYDEALSISSKER